MTPLSATLPGAELAPSAIGEAELAARQREFEAARRSINTGSGPSKETKLREACEGFEAIFIQKLWEGMRATLPKDGLLSGSRDEKTWQSMYDQELGKSLAASGGIGLADMMLAQLSRNMPGAGEGGALSLARRPLPIEPVPIMPVHTSLPPLADGGAAAKVTPKADDLYSDGPVQPVAPLPPDDSGATHGSGSAGSATLPGSPDAAGPAESVPTAQTNPFAASAPEVAAALHEFSLSTGRAEMELAPALASAPALAAASGQTADQPNVTRVTHITNIPQRATRQGRSNRVMTGQPITHRGSLEAPPSPTARLAPAS